MGSHLILRTKSHSLLNLTMSLMKHHNVLSAKQTIVDCMNGFYAQFVPRNGIFLALARRYCWKLRLSKFPHSHFFATTALTFRNGSNQLYLHQVIIA